MYLSRKELSKYIARIDSVSDEKIANALIDIGFEVETMCNYARSNSNLVVGEILSCDKHPDSIKLNICKVNIGDDKPRTIVCGANNVRNGIKVIVALPGAYLSFQNIKIDVAELRGVVSEGMICSLSELGINDKVFPDEEKSGIYILPDDATPGNKAPLTYIGYNDTFFDLSITSNRNDCNSIYYLCRELAHKLDHKFLPLELFEFEKSNNKKLELEISTDKCWAFSYAILDGVKVAPSPKWLRNYLISHGVNVVNNIVDLTNYVLIELGQPMHAYDYDVVGNKLNVYENKHHVKIETLNNKELSAEKKVVVGSDDNIFSFAGIIGAKKGSINNQTRSIILEAAIWDYKYIRTTTTKLGWNTKSSQLFSKPLSWNNLQNAILLFIKICRENNWIENTSTIYTYNDLPKIVNEINFNVCEVEKLLGLSINAKEIKKILTSIGFTINNFVENNFSVLPPANRLDILRKEDVIEELLRFYGLDNIRSIPPCQVTCPFENDQLIEWERSITNSLTSLGFNQVKTYSLTDVDSAMNNNYFENPKLIKIANPLSQEREYMKTTLLNSMLDVIQYNVSRKQEHVTLFEIAKVYSDYKNLSINNRLCIASTYTLFGDIYTKDKINSDFYSFKMIIQNILSLESFDISHITYRNIENDTYHLFHPVQKAAIYFKDTFIGVLGKVNPKIKKQIKCQHDIIMAELNLTKLNKINRRPSQFKEISKFPIVKRDFSFLLDKEITAQRIENTIEEAINKLIDTAGKILNYSINIFDVYEGEKIKENKKSVAIEVLISTKEQISDAEIKKLEEIINDYCSERLESKLRIYG
ncbi:hypothetical protein ASO20_02405 [Mycoplasma sp. (ex Biomphalaria glabrata)]|uniref:phenylalanine--tRNA ligase subunit beta n=1 Tax=Mycoplasma sp. (ex Biomphalaria glabrata) TaxID=1749074 RepID=UPI00073AC9C6|nr:phenylalanine--tRNA ligase subunit beta [Mycoplasma sp. (ex Biomphalaria glabrata)]ALV23486.1 hypothetical protein ASO20_02405 [Mycoplasma sp. (ex Biomphalaria glabrata)]